MGCAVGCGEGEGVGPGEGCGDGLGEGGRVGCGDGFIVSGLVGPVVDGTLVGVGFISEAGALAVGRTVSGMGVGKRDMSRGVRERGSSSI